MDIREKVITGLKCKLKEDGKIGCADCPYDEDFNCIGCDALLHDVLTLLKAQEPVEPKQYEGTSYCGNCGDPINKLDNYCHECGRRVKWE